MNIATLLLVLLIIALISGSSYGWHSSGYYGGAPLGLGMIVFLLFIVWLVFR